jgi:hypothetical protein
MSARARSILDRCEAVGGGALASAALAPVPQVSADNNAINGTARFNPTSSSFASRRS